jgi:uncharacterized protein YqhQ
MKRQWLFLSFPLLFSLIASKRRKVGGQAIIEGVMMRGKDNISWAVRKNEQDVVVERQEFISICKKYKILQKPVFRGAISLFESLILGYKALTRSAEIVEEEQRKTIQAEGKPIKERNKTGEKIATGFSLAVSLIIVFGIFMYLPMWIFSHFVPKESAMLFNAFSGVLRIIFFLIYLILISFWKEIRRVFEYHGAEHMAIFTYEAGQKLTIENMRRFTTLHPRCGPASCSWSALSASCFGRSSMRSTSGSSARIRSCSPGSESISCWYRSFPEYPMKY